MKLWAIPLDLGSPANLNHRKHWSARNDAAQHIRQVAWASIRAARVPRLAKVHMRLDVTPPDRRRRDSDNLVATLKPVKDALVDAGVVPDDTPEFVTWDPPVLLPADGRREWRYLLTLREVVDA